MLAILTPTFNRAYTISRVYESLKKQTSFKFVWYIVDDGSTDNTKDIVNGFIQDNMFDIRYFYKDNGGRHTAINYGVEKIKEEFILILDSDDELLENAVDTVLSSWEKYCDNSHIGCLSFLKVFPDKKVIGKEYNEDEIVSNHIDFRYNKGLLGDMCEVWRRDVLKKYPFPVFSDERFLSEAIIWNKIALDYDTVYINQAIYVADYLEDGLSKNSLQVRYNNPIGALENANAFLNKRFKLFIRCKNAILYVGFSIVAKRKIRDIVGDAANKFLCILFFPLGLLFYWYIKIKCH